MTTISKAILILSAVFGVISLFFDKNPLNSIVGVDASYSDDDDPKFVTCQSAIKLSHRESGGKYFLNSSQQNYGSGSRQQVVSVTNKQAEHTSLWVVRESTTAPVCPVGTPVACNSIIRLTHNSSGKNLHSHQFRSGLSGQQEISCFGEGGEGDEGDDWRLVCDTEFWTRGRPFRLQHLHTDKYLGATQKAKFTEANCGNCPILHHLEAFGRSKSDDYSLFTAEVGIFIST